MKLQTGDATERRQWSKKHGGDTYGKTKDTDSKAPKKSKGGITQINILCKCGSTSHSHSTHRDCPLNTKYSNVSSIDHSEDLVCDKGDVVYTAKYQHSDVANTRTVLSDDESTFSDLSLEGDYLEDSMIYDSDDETQCTCGAEGRAHKKACPLNPHLLYQRNLLL